MEPIKRDVSGIQAVLKYGTNGVELTQARLEALEQTVDKLCDVVNANLIRTERRAAQDSEWALAQMEAGAAVRYATGSPVLRLHPELGVVGKNYSVIFSTKEEFRKSATWGLGNVMGWEVVKS